MWTYLVYTCTHIVMQYSDKNTICALYLFWVSTEQGMSVDSGGVLPIVLMHKCRVT